MSETRNKAIVRRFNIEVIQNGNRAVFDQLMAPDFVNRTAPAGAPHDAESLWHTFHHLLRPALRDLAVTIHEQIAEGDKVTTRKTISGVHAGPLMGMAATGRAITIDVIDIVRIRNGQYTEHWGINTLPGVLAGLKA